MIPPSLAIAFSGFLTSGGCQASCSATCGCSQIRPPLLRVILRLRRLEGSPAYLQPPATARHKTLHDLINALRVSFSNAHTISTNRHSTLLRRLHGLPRLIPNISTFKDKHLVTRFSFPWFKSLSTVNIKPTISPTPLSISCVLVDYPYF
ncbi:hypothetical protein L2E82_00809 [Cichorium intybus]|uniref:Uncharacterized protein n=1 Tax=Cichorium intybus TaxID=13427 RepID=A0ACB9GY57_CICIN|nr:hypothetical protein L2E82_00809 [Cichorium intybus]